MSTKLESTITVTPGCRTRVGFRATGENARIVTVKGFTPDGTTLERTFYDARGQYLIPCDYCDRGYRGEYAHIDSGLCYPCGGRGYKGTVTEQRMLSNVRRQLLARRRKNIARAEADLVKRAEREAFAAANPQLLDGIAAAALVSPRSFLGSLADQVAMGPLSERQVQVAERIIREEAEKDAYGVSLFWIGTVGDKGVEVTGTIRTVVDIPTQFYGGKDSVLLIIDTERGTVKVKGTSAWLYKAERGEQVTLVGTISKHEVYEDSGEAQTVMIRTKRVQ